MRTLGKISLCFWCFFLGYSWSYPVLSQNISSVTKQEIVTGWQFRQVGGIRWSNASVPGCVHLDLLNNHQIKDPFFSNNEADLQWIENKDWEYQVYFDADASLLNKKHISLVLEGLDTYAKVYLNGYFLLDADNMFRSWNTDCKKYLKPGKNQLFIRFASPVRIGKEKTIKYPQSLPGGAGVFTRKAAYQFGWDWAARFVTCGVWKPVYLQAWDDIKIKDIHVVQHSVTDKEARFTAEFSIEQPAPQKMNILVKDANNGIVLAQKPVNSGTSSVQIDFAIESPKLWWTNGLGEPYLYHLQFIVSENKPSQNIDTLEMKIGIRTLQLVQDSDAVGRSFYFKLNGVPVFMKGANYIPPDNFLSRVTDQKYTDIVNSAKEANMNMLRVWGGGAYEKDKFYDLCDENGILVWQDFMFACAMYPEGSDFLENIKEESVQNIIRLRNHACMALWCGNNEMDEGWHNWGWKKQYRYSANDSTAIWDNYMKIFEKMLPELVEELDSAAPYVSSSPQIGWGRAESMKQGDSHYWGVWWGDEPFEVFTKKVPRFMSEFGFQGFPDKKTIVSFTIPDERYLYSDAMKTHQKHPKGYELIREYMQRDYRIPDSLDNYIYVSQLLQAKGITMAIEAQRRAKPYCMGSLYWQLNDCWPVVSWSGIDYYGRWKALHYLAKKAFAPVIISPAEDSGRLKIYVVSDLLSSLSGKLQLRLCGFDGKTIKDTMITVNMPANVSRCFYDADVNRFTGRSDLNHLLLEVRLLSDDTLTARAIHYFVSPKTLDLPEAKVNYLIKATMDGFKVTLTTNKLAKNVFLNIDDTDGFFSDNYFDMLPGDKVDVYFHTINHQPINLDSINKSNFRVVTLRDSYK